MFKDFTVLRVVTTIIIPYIILYALYIQINGEASPGGGFQAGVIFASALIAFDLIFNTRKIPNHSLHDCLIILAILGVLIYAGTGVISLISDDNYLDYNSILSKGTQGQFIGIFLIELGVGLTVASVMYLIYSLLREH